MNCAKCGKECANAAGKAAHERHCKGEPTVPVEAAPTVAESATLLEMKGWKAITEGGAHLVKNPIGQVMGTFPTAAEAVRFVENTNRWIR